MRGPGGGRHQAASTEDLLRRGLLWLSIAGTVGTAIELALLRHWMGRLELIAFGALAVLAVAIVLVGRRPTARSIVAGRWLAMTVVLTSIIGVLIHVHSNYEAAPLDFRYTASWPTTPEPVRWLLAVTDTVGPSPTLAPAAIGFIALLLLMATVRHPATRRS